MVQLVESERRLTTNASQSTCRGLRGGVNLVCASNDSGESYIKKQYFSAPIHLSKPYWDGSALIVTLVSPTAGLLEGDVVDCCVRLERDACVLLTSPAATRVHTMSGPGHASWQQKFEVESGAFLEYYPEFLILQKDARFIQKTKIYLNRGATLLFIESVIPGRIGRGESFLFHQFKANTQLYYNNNLIVLENFNLEPNGPSVNPWRSVFKDGCYASVYFVGEQASTLAIDSVHALQSENLWLGASPLVQSGLTIKLLAKSNLILRKALLRLRSLLYETMHRNEPVLRRT